MASFTSLERPFTVFVEGNIGKHADRQFLINYLIYFFSSGSGKTTFLNHFKKFQNNICLMTEPVENWRNLNVSLILIP